MIQDMTNLQKRASNKMHEKGWDNSVINNDSPAIERLISDMEGGREEPRYTKIVKPIDGSYISAQARSKPELANRLMQNLSQRTNRHLRPVRHIIGDNVDEAAAQVALGSKSIESSKALYNALGILDAFYGNDIVETRYSQAAQLYAQYLAQQKQDQGGESGEGSNQDITEYDMGDGHSDLDQRISAFQEYIETAEPYFRLISKYIDRTMNPVNTVRIKRTRIEDEDGDITDLQELDLSQFNKISSESLQNWAAMPHLIPLFLDEMTMEVKYRNEMQRYIDVFVVDNSGSMSGMNILRGAAFIFNRLEKVEKGDAMMAIVEFDTDTRLYNVPDKFRDNESPIWMIDTKKKAQWAMKSLVRKYVRGVGGGTNIPLGVMRGIELAREMEKLGGVMPNITVVTDDDSSINGMDYKSVPMPVNGLALKGNYGLQTFCGQTNGLYNNLEQIKLDIRNIT